jgi:hypothetical protein
MAKESSNRDVQIASSNSTFNMFVGGGPLPSWLMKNGEETRLQNPTTTATTRRAAPQGNKTRKGGDVHRPETGM